jgi:hypothetical protein
MRKLSRRVSATPGVDESRNSSVILAWGSGTALAATVLALTHMNRNPSPFQRQVIVTVLAFAIGALTTVLPGFIELRLTFRSKLLLSASSALAVFVIVYFFAPAMVWR